MSGLIELAERCEAAVWSENDGGYPRRLDHQIDLTLGRHRLEGQHWATPAYTTSLDAALTLVPEGVGDNWSLIGSEAKSGAEPWQAEVADELADAATPALALCAAALRARSHTNRGGDATAAGGGAG